MIKAMIIKCFLVVFYDACLKFLAVNIPNWLWASDEL
jgi:hypothetical protein